jgi:hypothetical protein
MNHNEWSYAWVAIIVAFVVLRAVFRMIRGLGKDSGSQMARLNAAAKRVLQEQKTGRSPIPQTQAKRPSSQSQQRQQAENKPRRNVTKTARPLTANATPAVIRRGAGLLSGSREPVIQRRR